MSTSSVGEGYRPDIDGLRALAVLSVVAYHIDAAWLPGGYVGVDIFFVISGYLITRNIWGEMLAGRFSLGQFYLRRIRRIAPAFLVMAAVTVLAGSLLLLPQDLDRLSRSALWGVFSAANVFYWLHLDTGYFAESSSQEPLLHTWSLGVEEQFYFLWPALLLVLLRAPRRQAMVLAAAALVCVVSFAAAEWWAINSPKFAYYMLPARAGELMVGALLALSWRDRRPVAGGWKPETMAVAGLALVAYALFALNDESRFPGINAVYPCLGAALLMLAGQGGSRLVRLLFTSRPVVAIGLVSYSLYLWHWPILAYARYFLGEITSAQAIVAVAAMAVLSVLSYRFVEQPARRWRAAPMKQAIGLYGVPSALLAGVAIWIISTQGLKSTIEDTTRFSEAMAKLEEYTAPAGGDPGVCQLSRHDPEVLDQARCVLGAEDLRRRGEQPQVLLWGDSNAAHYVGALYVVAYRNGFLFRNATHSSCPPVFGGDYGLGRFREGCNQFRPLVEEALRGGQYRTVVMASAWDNHFRLPGFEADFERTIDELADAGIRVVLLGQIPRIANYGRQCDVRAARIGGLDCRTRNSIPDRGETGVNKRLARMAAARDGVEFLGLHGVICRQGRCDPYLRDRPVYYDAGHLSMSGSEVIGRIIDDGPLRKKWLQAISPPGVGERP
ncbi:acyltransferase family protein [Arenimonas aestuarii]